MMEAKKYLCNNCGTYGHLFYNCRKPITSFGVVCYRLTPQGKAEYLLVQRKDSLGYVDFLRGKYNEKNEFQLRNILQEVTLHEKECIIQLTYKQLWEKLWNKSSDRYDMKNEDKFNFVKETKHALLNELCIWEEPEWGFPKGRRNYKEKELECALREFEEETGYSKHSLQLVKNLNPFEEVFTGSNLKSYKHRYFLAKIPYVQTLDDTKFQKSEIGSMKWCDYDTAKKRIRPYNVEKLELLSEINLLLKENVIF